MKNLARVCVDSEKRHQLAVEERHRAGVQLRQSMIRTAASPRGLGTSALAGFFTHRLLLCGSNDGSVRPKKFAAKALLTFRLIRSVQDWLV